MCLPAICGFACWRSTSIPTSGRSPTWRRTGRARRSPLVDLLRDKDQIASPGELRQYASRLPSGLRLLAAPRDPAVMAQMTPELYGELRKFLRRFYEVILLDLGTGVTAPIATFAVDQADQVVVVTTPEWITNTKVQMALGHLRLERATLVLNKVDGRSAQRATERQFSRERIAQRVAVPADLQLKTMLTPAPSRSRDWRARRACRSSG
jgi:MinD-like ATPase involved in chromosome partitioning or flagellar assembly